MSLRTEGYIAAIKSSNKDIPTRVIYFGGYNPFNSQAVIDPNDPEKKISVPTIDIEGYLMDELEEEDKNNDLLHFLGPVGDYMAYIKCGLTKCDVYYSEILVGRLYVGYLYTLNNFDEEEDFCPIEFINSSASNLLYIKCQCPGVTSIKIFNLSFSYTRGDLFLYEEIPLDIVDSKDLSMMLLN